MPVLLCQEDAVVPADGTAAEPPPGSILALTDGPDPLTDVSRLLAIARQWPWCAVALAVSASSPQDLVGSLGAIGILATITEPAPDGLIRPLRIRSAVVTRPPPDRSQLATWLEHRLPGDKGRLAAMAVRNDQHGTGLRRRLRKSNLWPPSRWSGCYGTVSLLAEAARRSWSEEAAAGAAGTDAATLSRRCRRVFGTDWRHLMRLGFWEAWAELALRHGGLVPAGGDRRT